MLEFKFDTQLLIDGHNLDEDAIFDYITTHLKGDSLPLTHLSHRTAWRSHR